MTAVIAGTSTYGRVKSVKGTPIFTQFFMLQLLPLYPLQSYYFIGHGEKEMKGVPFLASQTTAAIHGIPLATVDRTSVAMAYVRGLFGGLAVAGCMAFIPIIIYFTGERLDAFAQVVTAGLIVAFLVGVTGGALTYAVPLTSNRERDVRSYCAEWLGIAADPALVTSEISATIERKAMQSNVANSVGTDRKILILQLVVTRSRIARGLECARMEALTDQLLEELRRESAAT